METEFRDHLALAICSYFKYKVTESQKILVDLPQISWLGSGKARKPGLFILGSGSAFNHFSLLLQQSSTQ